MKMRIVLIAQPSFTELKKGQRMITSFGTTKKGEAKVQQLKDFVDAVVRLGSNHGYLVGVSRAALEEVYTCVAEVRDGGDCTD